MAELKLRDPRCISSLLLNNGNTWNRYIEIVHKFYGTANSIHGRRYLLQHPRSAAFFFALWVCIFPMPFTNYRRCLHSVYYLPTRTHETIYASIYQRRTPQSFEMCIPMTSYPNNRTSIDVFVTEQFISLMLHIFVVGGLSKALPTQSSAEKMRATPASSMINLD